MLVYAKLICKNTTEGFIIHWYEMQNYYLILRVIFSFYIKKEIQDLSLKLPEAGFKKSKMILNQITPFSIVVLWCKCTKAIQIILESIAFYYITKNISGRDSAT